MPLASAHLIHLHLLSDSTGETLELMAKAGLAQFEAVDAVKHHWPMVRSDASLERVLTEVQKRPGLILFTLANHHLRIELERKCRERGMKAIPVLDALVGALSAELGQEAVARPGRQHALDAAYFARVDAIQFTIAHDDGINQDNWEEADILLAGVSRTSKTPTSIYLANRGYKVANIPIVPEAPLPPGLFSLTNPLLVGLTTSVQRLVQIRRNRLLSLNQAVKTSYVDQERVQAELAYARRLFADNGVPVIDVTRRSIEESAAAIIKLLGQRETAAA